MNGPETWATRAVTVWVDGHRTGPATPAVPATDLGLRQGFGVFETMRLRAGRVAGLEAHLARLAAGGRRLGIEVPAATVRAGLADVAAAAPADDTVLRVTVTAGDARPGWPPSAAGAPRTVVTLHPAPPWCGPAEAAALVPGPRAPAGLGDVKTTSYAGSVLATRSARAAGADVALIELDGSVLEAADGNLVVLRDGVLVTPPTDGRIVPGVTRGRLLALAPALDLAVSETAPSLDEVRTADLVLVTSAVRGLRPIDGIDGVPVGTAAGTVALAALREGLERSEHDAPRIADVT